MAQLRRQQAHAIPVELGGAEASALQDFTTGTDLGFAKYLHQLRGRHRGIDAALRAQPAQLFLIRGIWRRQWDSRRK